MSDSVNRLTAVVLTVSDLDRAIRLYEDGLGLDAAHARAVAARARVIHDPKPQPRGRWAGYFDHDDNVIELTQS